MNAILLSEYILNRTGGVNHLKLQKTLYYIEGFFQAIYAKNIVEGGFQAWKRGPVNTVAYDNYKFKSDSLLYGELKPEYTVHITEYLTASEIQLVDYVIGDCNQYDADALVKDTHTHTPWIDARKGLKMYEHSNAQINSAEIRKYFITLVAKSTSGFLSKYKDVELIDKLFKRYDRALTVLAQ